MGEGVRREGCDGEVVGNHDTGKHPSWGQCRRAWGRRGQHQGGTQECAGKTELPSGSVLSACALSSSDVDVVSFFPVGKRETFLIEEEQFYLTSVLNTLASGSSWLSFPGSSSGTL